MTQLKLATFVCHDYMIKIINSSTKPSRFRSFCKGIKKIKKKKNRILKKKKKKNQNWYEDPKNAHGSIFLKQF